jgi:hypothetical protein
MFTIRVNGEKIRIWKVVITAYPDIHLEIMRKSDTISGQPDVRM